MRTLKIIGGSAYVLGAVALTHYGMWEAFVAWVSKL